MAARQEDFFTGDDLDAIFAVIDNDILQIDVEDARTPSLPYSHLSH